MRKQLYLAFSAILAIASCKTQQVAGNKDATFPAYDREAHRGGRGLMPENTIPAMIHAIDLGVETIEMDTHISADNQVVLSHDDYVNPLFTLTPDGKSLTKEEALKLPLFKMNYAEIVKYDVGSKPYSLFPQQKKMKVHMPLLSELIDSVQNHLRQTNKRQVFYNIETKCSAADDGKYNPEPEVFVKLLMDVIKSKKLLKWVVIQSFDKRTIQIVHKKYPGVRTSWLIDNKLTLEENLADLGYTPFIYSIAFKYVTPELVKQCHDKGIKIVPWTVNKEEDIARIKALGVDGMISDYPDRLMK